MSLEPLEEDEDAGAGALLLPVGLFVPVLFSAFARSQDPIGYLVVFGAFAACLLYGEANLTLPSGMALVTGLLFTSFAAQLWWLVGLGICAGAVSLARYGLSGSELTGEDSQDLELPQIGTSEAK